MPNSDNTLTPKRIPWIDIAKGISITLVVMGHVIRGLMGSSGNYDLNTLEQVDRWIYSFHIPVFFFLSGLFAPRASQQSPQEFFLNKFRTIFYPYLLWSAVLGVLRVLSGQGSKNFSTFALSFWQVIYKPTDIFWFFYALFLISGLYYLLRRVQISHIALIIGALFLSTFAVFRPDFFAWSPLNRVMLYAVYFVTAAALSDRLLQLKIATNKVIFLVIGTLGLILITLFNLTDFLQTVSPNPLISTIGIGSILSLSIFSIKLSGSAWIRTLGTYSLQIYVAHTIIGALIRTGLFKVFKIDNFWIHFTLETLAGLYIPVLLAIISLKIFPYLFFIPKPQKASIG